MLVSKPACLLARGSSYDREQPIPAHGPRPAPYHPRVLAFENREEDDLGPPDDVLERHVPDLTDNAPIGGIVAIVAHHEIMAGGHLIDRSIIVEAVVDEIERRIAHAVRQSLTPTLHSRGARAFLGIDEILDTLALDRLTADTQHPGAPP